MNILIILLSTICIFLFIILLLKNYQLAKYFRLLDKPELEKHKIHKEVIPATGGVYIFLLLCVYTTINYQNINITFNFLLFSIYFVVGLVDDIIKIKSINRLIILLFFTAIYLIINDNLIINYFYSDIYNKIYFLNEYNFIFTTFCLVTLFVIMNMLDGVDGLMILYSMTIFIIMLFIKFDFLLMIIFSTLILLLYLNLNKKIFLGNNGAGILSAIIGYYLITYSYNFENYFSELKIILLLFLPFIDFIRLTILRIANKKNPFKGDNNHFHHYFLKNKIFVFFVPPIIIFTYYFSFYNIVLSFVLLNLIYWLPIIFIKKL